MSVRLLLVGEDLLVQSGLATNLAREPAISVLGQVAPQDDILAETRRVDPNVVLWDTGLDFLAHSDRLRELSPWPVDLALIAGGERGVREMYSIGARGFFLRDADPELIASSLIAISKGGVAIDPTIAGAMFSTRPQESPLSPRELEVLSLLSEGLSNKQIAARLGISENTSKFHVNAILSKLGAETRTEAVVLGARLGLIIL